MSSERTLSRMDAIFFWKFEASLNEAITATIAEYRRVSSARLNLNNVDCSGAVARWLYTVATNDNRLRKYFSQIVEKKNVPRFIFVSSDLTDVARQLLKVWGAAKVDIVSLPGKRQRTKWTLLAAALKQRLHALIKKEKAKSPASLSPDILLFANHQKFVDLLRTSARTAGLTYAFVVANDKERINLGIAMEETIRLPTFPIVRLGYLIRAVWPEISYLAYRIEATLQQHRPKLLMYCEGDAWYHELIAQSGAKHTLKSICLQWGASPYETPRIGFRNFSCTFFLSWGGFFSEQLRAFNPKTCFVQVGHPLIESATHMASHKRMTFLLNTDPNGKFYGSDSFHQEFWQFLIRTAETAIDWHIIVRQHPAISLLDTERSELSKYRNVEIHTPRHHTLSESLRDSDIAITVTSSAVIEAASMGAIPFIYNPNPWRYNPDFDRNGAGIEAKSHQEALALMLELISNPEILSERRRNLYKFRGSLFAATGKQAQTNIAELIQSQIAP